METLDILVFALWGMSMACIVAATVLIQKDADKNAEFWRDFDSHSEELN